MNNAGKRQAGVAPQPRYRIVRAKEGAARIVFTCMAIVSILAVILICAFLFLNGVPGIAKIRFCDRPFQNADEMDEAIISNWNRRVANGDTVFILGDMMFKNSKTPAEYLSCLKGHKMLILGNHDAHWIWQEGVSKYLDTNISMMELIEKQIVVSKTLKGSTISMITG